MNSFPMFVEQTLAQTRALMIADPMVGLFVGLSLAALAFGLACVLLLASSWVQS